MKKTRLYLFRHGEVSNAAERTYNGQSDVDLSPEGVRQYKIIAQRLEREKIDAIYSSDLKRSAIGAEMIAKFHSIDVKKIKEVRELNYGIWEGMKVEDVMSKYQDEMKKRYSDIVNHRVEGGETLKELQERVLDAARKMLKTHMGETILLVGHGGVNRIILLWALNNGLENFYRIQQDYGAYNIVNYYENEYMEVELMNFLIYKDGAQK